MACAGKEPKDPVGRDLTKDWSAGDSVFETVGGEVLVLLVDVDGAVLRVNPTFMAALRMRILRRVRFMSSAGEVVVTVDVDLLLP